MLLSGRGRGGLNQRIFSAGGSGSRLRLRGRFFVRPDARSKLVVLSVYTTGSSLVCLTGSPRVASLLRLTSGRGRSRVRTELAYPSGNPLPRGGRVDHHAVGGQRKTAALANPKLTRQVGPVDPRGVGLRAGQQSRGRTVALT